MLRSAAVARRTAIAGLATQRISTRFTFATTRRLSFLPWRRSAAQPSVPVYFPKTRRFPSQKQLRRTVAYVFLTGFAYYLCFNIFMSFAIDPLLDWVDEQEEALTEKERQELDAMEEESPFFFIPFPFTIQEVEQPPYKGSDPEWAMFLKINKDRKLQKAIKLELAEVVRKSTEKNPAFLKVLGGKDSKVNKLWLDIIYPRSPPHKHYVSGLLWDEEGVFWGDRPVDSFAAAQIGAALYPKAACLAAWTFINTLASQTAQDVADALGFNNTESNNEVTWHSMAMDRVKEPNGLGNPGNQAVRVSTQSEKPPSLGISVGNGTLVANPVAGDFQVSPRIQTAMQAAALTFVKNWRPTPPPPTRGSVRVEGIVEVIGKRSVVAFYVTGWYDPQAKKFVTVHSTLKHLLPLKQTPG